MEDEQPFWHRAEYRERQYDHNQLCRYHEALLAAKIKPYYARYIYVNIPTKVLSNYYTAVRSLFRHVVCNVPVSCKANRDRNQFEAWPDSDPIAE